MSKDEFVYLEWRGLHDGWLAKYYPEEHTLEWRDHYVVDRLSDEKKKKLEQQTLDNFSDE